MNFSKPVSTLTIMAGMLAFSSAQAIVIDSFDSVPTFQDSNSFNGSTTMGTYVTIAPGTILGGDAEATNSVTAGGGAGGSPFQTITVNGAGNVGQYSYIMEPGVQGSSSLIYDGTGGTEGVVDSTGLGGVDLTMDGSSFFNFGIAASSVSSISLEIILYGFSGGSSSTTVGMPASVAALTDFEVMFSAFDAAIVGDLGAIEIIFNRIGGSSGSGFEDAGFSLDYITTGGDDRPGSSPSGVPVPGAVWLFGTGLFGLMGVSRRRKG